MVRLETVENDEEHKLSRPYTKAGECLLEYENGKLSVQWKSPSKLLSVAPIQ